MIQVTLDNTMRTYMTDLPVELQLQIIFNLPVEDIFQLPTINKHFYNLVVLHRPVLRRRIKAQVANFISTFQNNSWCPRPCCLQQRQRLNPVFDDIASSLSDHVFSVQPTSSLLFHLAALDCLIVHEDRVPYWLEWLFVDYVGNRIGPMAVNYMTSKRIKIIRRSLIHYGNVILPRMHVRKRHAG